MYLTNELNERFKAMWTRYTAPSDDPTSTVLRQMTPDELARATFLAAHDGGPGRQGPVRAHEPQTDQRAGPGGPGPVGS